MSEPFRVLLADDEPPALKRLRELFADVPDFRVTRECGDGDETLRALAEERFDLVLLDVQMPGRDGIEVARALDPARMPVLVFVTAFDRHAVDAFEVRALDYLLKPFDRERFDAMLGRVRAELARSTPEQAARLAELLSVGRAAPPLALRSGARTLLFDTADIEWVEAADNYVRLHGADGERLVRGTLSALAERLAAEGFVRIHRSRLVNARAVRELRPDGKGELELVLASGARLEVGRSFRRAVEARWPGRRLDGTSET